MCKAELRNKSAVTTLLVGFDSAWTAVNSGAIVGALYAENTFHELETPQAANYVEAEKIIRGWQAEHSPTRTFVMLDQPTIVTNGSGKRLVEKIVSSSISLRYGGMQPANTARTKMFGAEAPIWPFLARFGGAADPLKAPQGSCVFETYPVLTLIALGWTLPDSRATGRLPKYNPSRKKTFSVADWQHVCGLALKKFLERGLLNIAAWAINAQKLSPKKTDQDCLDACLCLLAGFYLAERKPCIMVGDTRSGYIVVPYGECLHMELRHRCQKTRLLPSEWVHTFQSAYFFNRG